MWSMNFDPKAAFSGMNTAPLHMVPLNTAPLLETWNQIAGLYRDATQESVQQLWLSSTNIIQEHTIRAFMAAAQSCAEALAQNAMHVQQQSMARFIETNQKAAAMMGSAFADAWTGAGQARH